MMQTITDYPIFEADQVLSQKHLNQLVGYLEEQDRMSRVLLHGMGIVCGLEISKPNNTTLHISCGTAITSLGFLIHLKENDYTQFKHSIISEDFLAADLSKHAYLENIYQWANSYAALSPCIELLPTNSEDEEREPLTDEILENKIVLLLVESPLIDLKNCNTSDCADKGKRLEMNVRVLLVDVALLERLKFNFSNCSFNYPQKLALSRLDVPRTNLIGIAEVLNAFNAAIKKSKPSLQNSIQSVHTQFEGMYGSLDNYDQLENVSLIVNNIHTKYKNTTYIQYVWDWLKDLAATYNEIAEYHACQISVCCPEADMFPFHILLGSANAPTSSIHPNDELYGYRTHFIYSGNHGAHEMGKQDILKGLFQKLILQLNTFQPEIAVNRKLDVRITPSNSGAIPLSEKAIPYYYKDILKVNEFWSPTLTQRLRNRDILSYHSKEYNNSNPQIYTPLLYDLEGFNFFRVEGHIGQDYAEAITEIVALQEEHRLPFKTIALNAVNYIGREIDISNQSGIWDDIELDYDLAKEKVYNITEYVISWIKTNKRAIQAHYSLMTDQTIANLEAILTESRSLLVEDLEEFIPNFDNFYEVFEELNELFLMHRLCVSTVNREEMPPIMEDLIDHFDEINNLFLEDPFTIIYEEVQRRWRNAVQELFLSKFLQKHPGITHGAGVPKGGTLILLYADHSIFIKRQPTIRFPFLLHNIIQYKALFNFTDAQKEQVKEHNVVRKRAKLKGRKKTQPENDPCVDEKNRLKEQFRDALSIENPNLPLASRKYIQERMRNVFDENMARIRIPQDRETEHNIREKTIFADFYLPYICCGNGDNINIIIQKERDSGVADFDHQDFNDDDFFTNKNSNN